jgi:hypothetical protein
MDDQSQKLLEELRKRGIVPDEWAPGKPSSKNPLTEKQRSVLLRLEGLVRQQIKADLTRLSALHGELIRKKRGGSG